jgi:hypothetical protein
MTSVPLAQNPPHSTSLSITPERLEAARICCLKFEERNFLHPNDPHTRVERDLTSSELLRITSAFFMAWRMILDTQSDVLPTIQEHVEGLLPRDVMYVRQLAQHVSWSFGIRQLREMERMMGYYAGEGSQHRWTEIVTVTTERFHGVVHVPRRSPMNLDLLADDMQEDYVDSQVEDYHRRVAWLAARGLTSF